VKYLRVIVLSMFLIIVIAAPAAAEVVADKIIAVINDEVITQKEFNKLFEPYLQRIEQSYKGNDKETIIKQTKDALLQKAIDNLLIDYEAGKMGVSIKDEELMNVLKDMLIRQNIGMEDLLKKLDKEGSSIAFVKKEIKGQLTRMKLMRWEIKAKIVISDQEIGEYYNQHREEYEGKEAVRLKQILLLAPQNAGKAMKAKIKENAEKIQKRALNGESFDYLAAQYSQGPAAGQEEDLGFIEKGGLIPEMEMVAFSMPPGQISNVIESKIGFHIIKVMDKRGAGLKPIANVREEIKARLEDGKLEKKYDEWISDVRKRSYIEIR
jgi:parvulin-like peptidyl-prolyl isomerase